MRRAHQVRLDKTRGHGAARLCPPYAALQELPRHFRPFVATAIGQRFLAVLRPISLVPRAQAADARACGLDALMRRVDEKPLDRPYVSGREPPVVAPEPAQIDERITGDAAGRIDIRIEI